MVARHEQGVLGGLHPVRAAPRPTATPCGRCSASSATGAAPRSRSVQQGDEARVVVTGDGDLDAAATQACRFLSLDVDARGWPDVGRRDPVIADAQERLPGLRPCGFHSPYEAAAWAVLSQRLRIVQAARLL